MLQNFIRQDTTNKEEKETKAEKVIVTSNDDLDIGWAKFSTALSKANSHTILVTNTGEIDLVTVLQELANFVSDLLVMERMNKTFKF